MSEEQAREQAGRSGRVRALVPARYSAWLSGDLGRRVVRDLNAAILEVHQVPELVVRRIASGIVVQGREAPGPFVGSLAAALVAVERSVGVQWPVMHAKLGSVFTGSVQVMLPDQSFRHPGPGPPGRDRAARPSRAGEPMQPQAHTLVLDSGDRNRQRILAVLDEHPGLCFRTLLRRTGLAAGILRHHVAVMERRGQLVVATCGQRVLHFTEETPPTPERIHEAMLQELGPDWQTLYDHVTRHPGQRQGTILDAFPDQSRSTVQHRLWRLVELDILRVRPVGLHGIAYEPASPASEAADGAGGALANRL